MVNKVTLAPVTGANNIVNINDNFSKLERVVNDTMLSRKVGAGQPNQVLSPIDMNGQRMFNLPDPQSSGEPVTFRYVESVQASVDGLEELVVEAQGQLTAAQLANQQAQGILVDTRVIQVDVINKANQVNVQAGQVAAQAAQVNTQAGQVAASVSAAASSASAAAGSASTATAQATNAANSAAAANTSKLAAEAAVTAAIVAKDAASASATASAASATASAASAVDAANAAGSINQSFLLDRANHTGVQAISTITGLQTALNGKKNITDNTTIAQGGTGATTAAGARTNLGLGTAAVAAIVGTVSQSGGVPTGAIIQRNSNANGETIRFADGTQLCVFSYTYPLQVYPASTYTSSSGWTFPTGFIAAPRVFGTVGGSDAWRLTFSTDNIGLTSSGGLYISNVTPIATVSTAISVSFLAVGRWF